MRGQAKGKHPALHGLTGKVPVVPATYTLGETQSFLIQHRGEFDTIDYIYATDSDGKLTGVFSITDLYRHLPATKVNSLFKKPLVTAQMTTHPEEIAYLALQHGIKAVPIVDENHKLLGIIPHDVINRTLYRELRTDILHLAGVHRGQLAFENVLEVPLLRAVWHRLPWLLVGIIGGLGIAQIIEQFEETVKQNLVLVAFIPLVVYIADAVGTQLEAFAIRDFALFRKLNFGRYFTKHLLTVLVLAALLGTGSALIARIVYGRFDIAAVLGLAVVAATLSALFSGLVIPYAFRKINIDPANASGPLGTIIQDAVSIIIYLAIASVLLG